MSSSLKQAGVWMLVALLTGCTTLKPLPPRDSPRELAAQLKIGDQIRVITIRGERVKFKVTEVGQSTVSGTRDGNAFQLPYEQIAAVDVQKVDGLKTVGVTALGILAAFGVLLVGALASW